MGVGPIGSRRGESMFDWFWVLITAAYVETSDDQDLKTEFNRFVKLQKRPYPASSQDIIHQEWPLHGG